MRIRKVSAEMLQKPARAARVSPREAKRLELEAALERVIREAAAEPSAAFRVTLLSEEKLATVRAAFRRAKAHVGAEAVNLVTVGGDLYVAATPARRGRRPKPD